MDKQEKQGVSELGEFHDEVSSLMKVYDELDKLILSVVLKVSFDDLARKLIREITLSKRHIMTAVQLFIHGKKNF